jgi:uncharacterized protein YbcI
MGFSHVTAQPAGRNRIRHQARHFSKRIQRSHSPSADAVTYDRKMATDDSAARRTGLPGRQVVTTPSPSIPKELAQIALSLQTERSGHSPKAVTVVASDETVVVTLHEALTPAEKLLARSAAGAAQVEGYHRALFAVSCDQLRSEIQRLTGRRNRPSSSNRPPARSSTPLRAARSCRSSNSSPTPRSRHRPDDGGP